MDPKFCNECGSILVKVSVTLGYDEYTGEGVRQEYLVCELDEYEVLSRSLFFAKHNMYYYWNGFFGTGIRAGWKKVDIYGDWP